MYSLGGLEGAEEEPEATWTGRDRFVCMGSGESLSCEVRSVYLCRCLLARRGLGGCPAEVPAEGDHPIQELAVVLAS